MLLDTLEYKGFKIQVHQDEDAESPRDWDNLGEMVCWHRRYSLGDKHNYESPEDFRSRTKDQDGVTLPLYLMDHSGLSMNTTGFGCPWDSGQVGYIWVSKDKLRKEYSAERITKAVLDKAREVLVSEVKTYDEYLRGEVYGYVIVDPDGNNDDSCWGFFGHDYMVQEAKSIVDHKAGKLHLTMAQPGEH